MSVTLAIVFHGQNVPQLTATTIVTVPEAWTGTAALLDDPYSARFADAMSCFLPVQAGDYRPSAPGVVETKGSVVVTDTVVTTLDPLFQTSVTAGDWQITLTGRRAIVTLAAPEPTMPGRWSVVLDTGGSRVIARSPVPTANDGTGVLRWQGLRSGALGDLSVTTIWPDRMALDALLRTWPRKWVAELGWSSSALVVFLLPLWFVWRSRKEPDQRKESDPDALPGRDSGWSRRMVRRYCWMGLVFVLASVADDRLWDMPDFGSFDQWLSDLLFAGNAVSASDIQADLELAFLLPFAAWLYLASRERRSAVMTSTVLLAVAAALALAVRPAWWSGSWEPLQDYTSVYHTQALPPSVSAVVVLCLGAMPLALAVYLLLSGCIAGLTWMWPVRWDGQPREASSGGRRPWRRSHRLALLLTVVTYLEIAYSADQSWRHVSVLGNGTQLDRLDWILMWVLAAPHWFLRYELGQLLVLLVIVGIVAWIHSLSRPSAGLFLPEGQGNPVHKGQGNLVRSLLLFLFAASGVGTFGEGILYTLPIAFAVGYLLVRPAAGQRDLEDLDKEVRIEPPPGHELGISRLAPFQGPLLDAADRRAGLRKELAALDQSPPAGRADEVARCRRELEEEIDSLGRCWEVLRESPPSTPPRRTWIRLPRRRTVITGPNESVRTVITSPAPVDPGQIAVRLGPTASWWDNGWQAVRVGLVPALVLTCLYTWIEVRRGSVWQAASEFGLLDSLAWEIEVQLLSWFALAFVLGALYPYVRGNNGPVKGTVLGLVVTAATMADAVPTYLLDGLRYDLSWLDSLTTVAFLVLTAILLDRSTLMHHRRSLGWVAALYRTATLRLAISYAATLLIIGVGFWQQAHISNSSDQQKAQIISQLIKETRAEISASR